MVKDFINKTADRFGFIPLTREFAIDSMWGNFICASNGKIYIAAGNHETFKGDTWFFEVDPKTDQVKQLFSVAEILGVRVGTTAVGECKIHTRLVETADGKIIFATMQGGIGHISKYAHYEHPDQHEGGHLFAYDTKTGNVHDYGVLVKGEGLQTQVLDPVKNIIYFVTWPKKIFGRYDLNKRRTDTYGVFCWSPAREDGRRLYFGRDILYGGDGKVYSINHHGCMIVFDPVKDSLEDTSIFVRKDDSLRANVLSRKGINYFITNKGYIFSFDAKKGKVEELGMVMPNKAAYTPNLAITHDEKKLVFLAGCHSSYGPEGIPLVEFDLESRKHHIVGDLDPDFFPPSCFGAWVDSKGRYAFALHGGEISHSYLAIYDPANPKACKWLLPHGSKPSKVYHAEGVEGFGRTKGWVVADYQVLNEGPGDGIPNGETAITSLISSKDGFIYGATSVEKKGSAWLFRTRPGQKKVEALARLADFVPTAQRVKNSLVEGCDGCIYGGTQNLVEEIHIEKRSKDFPKVPDEYPGGSLFRYNPKTGKVESLGIPVKGQGIYAMCGSPSGDKIYAITYPHAYLISLDVKNRQIEKVACIYDEFTNALRPDEFDFAMLPVGNLYKYPRHTKKLKQMRGIPEDTKLDDLICTKKVHVSRAIVCDLSGKVYGSAAEGKIFCYDPGSRKLEILSCSVPMVCGTNYGLISDYSVQSLMCAENGMIYGGTSQDGYLFRFDPVKRKVFNFGKPIIQGEIRGLIEWKGAIHGIVGEEWGKPHLFRYDEKEMGMEDLGVLQGGGRSGFPVNVCSSMVKGSDESIFIGQSERSSCLLKIGEIKYEPILLP